MNDTRTNNQKKNHDVFLSSREKLSLNGVKEIISFDDSEINLRTVCGELSIEGSKLHISILDIDKGDVELDGRINAIYYYDSTEDEGKKGLISRIFK